MPGPNIPQHLFPFPFPFLPLSCMNITSSFYQFWRVVTRIYYPWPLHYQSRPSMIAGTESYCCHLFGTTWACSESIATQSGQIFFFHYLHLLFFVVCIFQDVLWYEYFLQIKGLFFACSNNFHARFLIIYFCSSPSSTIIVEC